jgi:hypothetical protein
VIYKTIVFLCFFSLFFFLNLINFTIEIAAHFLDR